MQALNAKDAFGREADFPCQAAMEGPERQAGPGSQLCDSIAAVEGRTGRGLFSGPCTCEKVGDERERPVVGFRFAQLLQQHFAARAENRRDGHGSIREIR